MPAERMLSACLSVRLTVADVDALHLYAHRHHITASDIVRDLVRGYLARRTT